MPLPGYAAGPWSSLYSSPVAPTMSPRYGRARAFVLDNTPGARFAERAVEPRAAAGCNQSPRHPPTTQNADYTDWLDCAD
jgi:hypothetical protein